MSRGRMNMTIKEKNQAMKTETVVTTLWSTKLPYRLTRNEDKMKVIMISTVSGQKAIHPIDVKRKHIILQIILRVSQLFLFINNLIELGLIDWQSWQYWLAIINLEWSLVRIWYSKSWSMASPSSSLIHHQWFITITISVYHHNHGNDDKCLSRQCPHSTAYTQWAQSTAEGSRSPQCWASRVSTKSFFPSFTCLSF